MSPKIIQAIFIFVCFFFFQTQAQIIDSAFAVNGYIPYGIAGNSQQNLGIGNKFAIQPDGKIVVAIDKADPNGPTDLFFYTYRYNADGTTDSTFGVNGASRVFAGSSSINKDLKIQPDGKIIVIGESEYCILGICGAPQFVMMRLLTNGIVDSSFGTNGTIITSDIFGTSGLYANPNRVQLASNNKYIICGRGVGFTQFVARLNNNGTLDPTFATNGIYADSTVQAHITDMTIDANENIYTLFLKYSTPLDTFNYSNNYIVKLNANGILDNTFGTNGKKIVDIANDEKPSCIVVRPDGKIVITGTSQQMHSWGFGETNKGYVFILNSDGSMSNLLNAGSMQIKLPGDSATFIHTAIVTPNNQLLIGGQTMTKLVGNYHQKAFLALIKNDATFDNAFNSNGIMMLDHGLHSGIGSLACVLDIKLLTNNKLICSGYRNPIMGNVKKSVYLLQLKNTNFSSSTAVNNATSLENYFEIYPNPSNDIFYINKKVDNIEVYSAFGSKVLDLKKSNMINLSNAPKGIYFVQAWLDGQKISKKIVLN